MFAESLTLDEFPDTLSARDGLAMLARLAEAPAQSPSAPSNPDGRAGLSAALVAVTAEVLKLEPGEIPLTRPLIELGLDSISATDIVGRLNDRLGLSLPSTILFEFDHVTDLAATIWDTNADVLAPRIGGAPAPKAPVPKMPAREAPVRETPRPAAGGKRIEVQALWARIEASLPEARPRPEPAKTPVAGKRIDVQALWAQIEASLQGGAPPAPVAAPAAAPVEDDPWETCMARLSRRLPGCESIAFPDEGRLAAFLAAATAPRRLLWLSAAPAPDGATPIDPDGETALEDLLAHEAAGAGGGPVIALPAAEALSSLPVHLWRAVERMRARSGCLLVAAVPTPDARTLARLAELEADALWIGRAPLAVLALAPSSAARFDAGQRNAARAAYRNAYAARDLAGVLA